MIDQQKTRTVLNWLVTIVLMLAASTTFASGLNEEAGGAIRGKVTTSDGQPAVGVNVTLKNTRKSTFTDEEGNFIINGLEPGDYQLEISLVGYETKQENITIENGKTARVQIRLELSYEELTEIVVTSAKNRFANRTSAHVSKMPLLNLENPQVYNVISKDLMKEQVVVTLDDALKNAPGVSRLWSSTGRPGDGAGYFSMRGFSVQPTMINGVPGLTNGGVDPANIERIEAIKGPSGTLFGSSLISFGGLLNIVTKKPYQSFGGELNYTFGGFGLSRITADVNTPVNKDKSALFRLNAAYHSEGSFQDAGFKKSLFIAPSFSYKVNDRLSFLINAEILNAEATNATMIFLNRSRPLIAKTVQELNMDFNKSYTSNDITYKTPTFNVFGQASYKLSDKWTSQTNIARSVRKSDGYYSYIMFLDGSAAGAIAANDTLISRYVYYQNTTNYTTHFQQNFIGDFNIGKFRNRVIAGVDVMHIQAVNQSPATTLFDFVNVTRKNDPRYGQLNRAAVDAKAAAGGAPVRNRADNYTYSAYVSDVFNITPQLMAMLSLRFDHFDNKPTINFNTGVKSGKYHQNAVSPKLGLVYQVVEDKVSLFANYMNGFRNVAPIPSNEQAGYPVNLEPQQADQKEGGIKLDLLNHKLLFTASYYNILVKNITRSITVDNGSGTPVNVTIQDGQQKSKGLEFDLVANPALGLNIIAGYSYNDSRIEKAAPATDGRRPTSAGPANLANLWISYTATTGKLQGLGAGFGGNYAGKNLITSSLPTGEFYLPEYTVFNASVFYDAKKYRLAIKADNIADKEYFGGWTTIEKQMPRRFAASMTFKF
jgi:iron complex outermembrane receptor protein